MMKKNMYLCLIGLLGLPISLQAQQQFQGVNFGDLPKPVPSVSSFSTYTDIPVSLSTGIPNISIPLLALPTNGGANLSIQLSYNPMNASGEEAASEVGTGWSVFKGGVISRQVNNHLDEIFQSATNAYYEKNKFDDEYYYNLPGISGKFKIDRDIVNNTFKVIDLTPVNHVKIEYTRENNDATLIVNSFTITDDEGNRYYFNDYSSSVLYGSYYQSIGSGGREYKSAFFLTQIKNASNVEIANFIYKKETKYDGSTLLYKSCKLERINSSSGNIQITYDYDVTLEKTMNDPYSIKKITLNNPYAKVKEYAFDYSYPQVTYSEGTEKRRRLERIKKMNGDTVLEQTSFQYYPEAGQTQNNYCDPNTNIFAPSNILKKIIYPTKGMTEYVYEKSDTYVNKSTAAYLESISNDFKDPCLQYIQNFPAFSFDTNQTVSYTFTVSGDAAKKKAFWLTFNIAQHYQQPGPIDPNTGFPTIPPPITENQRMSYTLKKGSEIIASSQKGEYTHFYNYPGQYTLTINIPHVGGNGSFQLTELMLNPGPYRNTDPASTTRYRIQSVKRYKDSSGSTPDTFTSYSYDSFASANSSSGYYSLNKDLVFKNVKVTQGSGNGYTRYYFKTPGEYPSYPIVKDGNNATFWPNYNLTEAGLLEKKEICNQNNQVLNREVYEYTIATADNTDYVVDGNTYSKIAWINHTKQISETFPSGIQSSVLQTINESTIRADNYKPLFSKSIAADGTVTESFYKYAQDKNLTALTAANMTGIPVESEVKRNGKTIGKSETKFENAGNKYPSSSVDINPNNGTVKTAILYDLYDDMGNIVQYTTDVDPLTGKGNPVTIIWGYNKTMPIAKIPGAKSSDIGTLANDIVLKSNADISEVKEKELLTALDVFRNNAVLKRFPVITYTYDPLIGVTTVTPPTGLREYYQYDTAGRLQSVKDSNGNIVKEVKYNTKQ